MAVHSARFRYTKHFWAAPGPLQAPKDAFTPFYQRLLGGDAFINVDLSRPDLVASSEAALAEVFNQVQQPDPAPRQIFNRWSFGDFGRDYQGGDRGSLETFGWMPNPADARHLAIPLQTLPRTPFSISGLPDTTLEGRVWASLYLCGLLTLSISVNVVPNTPQPAETFWSLHEKLTPFRRGFGICYTSKSGIKGAPQDFLDGHETALEHDIYNNAGHPTPVGSWQLLAQLITDDKAIKVQDRLLGLQVVEFNQFGCREDDKLLVGERGVAFRDDVKYRVKGTRRRFETVARFHEFANAHVSLLRSYKTALEDAIHAADGALRGGQSRLYTAAMESKGARALQLGDLVYDFERAVGSETPAATRWQRALYSKLAEAAAIPPLREEIKAATTSLRNLTKEVRSERRDWLSRLKDLPTTRL